MLRPDTPPGRKSAGRPHVPPHFPGQSRKTESMPQCRNIFWNASPGRSMSLHTQNLRQSPHHTGRKKIRRDYGVCHVPKAWRRAQPLLSKGFACVLGVGEFCGRAFALRDRLSGKVCFCVPDLCPQQPFRCWRMDIKRTCATQKLRSSSTTAAGNVFLLTQDSTAASAKQLCTLHVLPTAEASCDWKEPCTDGKPRKKPKPVNTCSAILR